MKIWLHLGKTAIKLQTLETLVELVEYQHSSLACSRQPSCSSTWKFKP